MEGFKKYVDVAIQDMV